MRAISSLALSLALIAVTAVPTSAQHLASALGNLNNNHQHEAVEEEDSVAEALPKYVLAIDKPDFDSLISNPKVPPTLLPSAFNRIVVFDNYMFLDEPTIPQPSQTKDTAQDFSYVYGWLDDLSLSDQLVKRARQNFMVQNPWLVKYNTGMLPEPPKQYHAFVNPITTRIEFEEQNVTSAPLEANIAKRRWLNNFGASLQFSQAYISPNWYQGGNNALNLLAQVTYNLKLNQEFYPNYLFDMTVQYKLGVSSTPDDSIRAYNINEDLFQFNLTAGIKAARRWFYSGNVMFKTQIFKSYPINSNQLKSSFMSPGELNVGLGMTYNYANKKNNFNFVLSISPLSWNMKSCINNLIDETTFGIKPGRNMVNSFGSSFEANLKWQITYNISYTSRVFTFTDYNYLQADWENTIDFAINRYLSTRLYVHARYDTTTARIEDSKWHKLQLKEILSFGINYTFGVK